MAEFWPSGFNITDTASPYEILNQASEEWAEEGGGLLRLIIDQEDTVLSSTFDVHAEHVPSKRTISLFSVTHLRARPYPSEIGISWYGHSEMIAGIVVNQPSQKLVARTPERFRELLRAVFNRDDLKSELLRFVVNAGSAVVCDH